MCTHIQTSEFIPAFIAAVSEKGGKETFHIPESVLWKVANEIENRCWSNVMLTRPQLDDLVESMRRHDTYGPSFIEYDLKREDSRPLVLNHVDDKRRTAMANYFFDNTATWYSVLDDIVGEHISITDNGEVRFVNPLCSSSNRGTVAKEVLLEA